MENATWVASTQVDFGSPPIYLNIDFEIHSWPSESNSEGSRKYKLPGWFCHALPVSSLVSARFAQKKICAERLHINFKMKNKNFQVNMVEVGYKSGYEKQKCSILHNEILYQTIVWLTFRRNEHLKRRRNLRLGCWFIAIRTELDQTLLVHCFTTIAFSNSAAL